MVKKYLLNEGGELDGDLRVNHPSSEIHTWIHSLQGFSWLLGNERIQGVCLLSPDKGRQKPSSVKKKDASTKRWSFQIWEFHSWIKHSQWIPTFLRRRSQSLLLLDFLISPLLLLFCSLQASTDWMRSTHIREGNLPSSVYSFKC